MYKTTLKWWKEGLPEDICNEAVDYSRDYHLTQEVYSLSDAMSTMKCWSDYHKVHYWHTIATFIFETTDKQ